MPSTAIYIGRIQAIMAPLSSIAPVNETQYPRVVGKWVKSIPAYTSVLQSSCIVRLMEMDVSSKGPWRASTPFEDRMAVGIAMMKKYK